MKSIFLSLISMFLAFSFAYAYEITLAHEIYKRTEDTKIDKSKLLTAHFIDVGAGDGILIDTPTGKKILIDGGYKNAIVEKEYEAYLDHFLGDDDVDLMVISHPDYDHFRGLFYVLDNFVVHEVWTSGYSSKKLSGLVNWPKFEKKLEKLERDKCMSYITPLGDHYELGTVFTFDNGNTPGSRDDTILTLINTKKYVSNKAYGNNNRGLEENERRNSSSIVLRMDFGKTSFLFTGDVNGRGIGEHMSYHDDQEKFMVDNHKNRNSRLFKLLDVDILKVAHHGSDSSSSLQFLKATSPTWAVISAGFPHGHPHNQVIKRLEHVGVEHILRTDDGDDDIAHKANEATIGDDSYIFTLDSDGIIKIEKWNVSSRI